MTQGVLIVVAALFPIVNPLGSAPFFLALTEDQTDAGRRVLARKVAINGFVLLLGAIFVGDFIYPRYRLFILGVAVAAVAATWFIVYRTAFGRVVRAGVQNPDMVAALGISLQPYMSAVVAISVALAALAGVLLAPITGVHPAMGSEILTAAFVVVVIGGLGSFWGVVWAALASGHMASFDRRKFARLDRFVVGDSSEA
jgi:branched-subunit amino acid ABC-type transport system permease component